MGDVIQGSCDLWELGSQEASRGWQGQSLLGQTLVL